LPVRLTTSPLAIVPPASRVGGETSIAGISPEKVLGETPTLTTALAGVPAARIWSLTQTVLPLAGM
jgi:hypothetical protein